MTALIVFALSAFGVFLALFGAANLNPGTLGVGVIGLACFVGILARVAQAAAHHQREVDRSFASKSELQPVTQHHDLAARPDAL